MSTSYPSTSHEVVKGSWWLWLRTDGKELKENIRLGVLVKGHHNLPGQSVRCSAGWMNTILPEDILVLQPIVDESIRIDRIMKIIISCSSKICPHLVF